MPRIVDHARRREEIAKLAVRVIQEEGSENATVRRIAKAGGFSIGVLTHYFKDKDELVAFTFDWIANQTFADLDAAVGDLAPGLARLRCAIEFMVPTPGASSFMGVWLSLWGGAMHNPALGKVHRDYYARWRRYVTRYVREAIERGEIAAQESARDAVDLLIAGVDGLWIGVAFERERYRGARRRQLVTKLIDSVLASGPVRRRLP